MATIRRSTTGVLRTVALAVVLTAAVAPSVLARPIGVDKSANVKKIVTVAMPRSDFSYTTTDLAFEGNYAYVGGGEGVAIVDVSGVKPHRVGFFACPGDQNDVAVIKPGLIALGYHRAQCGAVQGGMTIVDVSDPSDPREVSSIPVPVTGVHTLTTLPGTDVVYASPGGSGAAEEDEAVIDVSDPRRPKLLGKVRGAITCHDLTIHTSDPGLAVCAGGFSQRTQIWDVREPRKPKVVSEIFNPALSHHHLAVFSDDGDILVIGDEWLVPGNCGAASLWVYDVSDPKTPELISRYGLQPGRTVWACTPHNFAFVPGTRKLVSSWGRGGMNVVDLEDPANPREIAHYVVDGAHPASEDYTLYWSAYPHRGRVYATDWNRGLDVFNIRGL